MDDLISRQVESSEITDEQAILHLQSTGWMQNHDREMYESGLREQLADDSGGYDSLIPCEDAISRHTAVDAVDAIGHIATMPDGDKCIRRSAVKYVLSMLPTAQPEQKKGYWKRGAYTDDDKRYNDYSYKCSRRGKVVDYKEHFCPNCRAKMEEPEMGWYTKERI